MQQFCQIILSKWCIKKNSVDIIGLQGNPDIFQEKMNKLLNGLEYVRTYIDDLLIISKNAIEDNVNKLDKVFTKLKASGFKVNVE